MSQGKPKESDNKRLVRHVFVLLDHLERQGDNRLQAHFDDTRAKLGINSAKVAEPPCDNYKYFLVKIIEIRKNIDNAKNIDDVLNPEDERFLRSSRDFLAVVAAPATVETISITLEYIRKRTTWALSNWSTRLLPRRTVVLERRDRAEAEEDGFRDSAHWLALFVRKIELGTIIVAVFALILSAHAMVGRVIINQEKKVLTNFQKLNKSADADRLELFRVAGAVPLVKFTYPDRYGCPAKYTEDENGKPQSTTDKPETIEISQKERGQFGKATEIGDPTTVAREAAWSLVAKCRNVQWAQIQLVAESARLRSWNNIYTYWPISLFTGWSQKMVDKFGSILDNEKFCKEVANTYHEIYPKDPPEECKIIFDLLIRDSASFASSILSLITMYILPCLYAFLGAAAATIIGLRRRIDTSLLSYSDRGRVMQALILGFIFGGVIGLFAGYLTKPLEGDGLGLSALALLAGYNVPAVSELLEDLSKRIFQPTEISKSGTPAT